MCVGFVCDGKSVHQSHLWPADVVCPSLLGFVYFRISGPWGVTRQSQGLNTGPRFSSDGVDRHGNRVKAFEGPQTHKQGYLAASISSDSHLKFYRDTKLLLGLSQIQQRTAAGRVTSPPALGGPQELPWFSPSPHPGRFRSGQPDFHHSRGPLLWHLGPLAGIKHQLWSYLSTHRAIAKAH